MAFALTKFRAIKIAQQSAVPKMGVCQIEMQVTRGSSDTDLDVGDIDGTFWTAAIADATYGTLATAANAWLNSILPSVISNEGFNLLGSGTSLAMIQVTSASAATNFAVGNEQTFPLWFPNFTLNASADPATLNLVIKVGLVDGVPIPELDFPSPFTT